MNSKNSAVSDAEFAASLTDVGCSPIPANCAAAVSGGADSMALALLLAAVKPATVCHYLIVDHGLRASSSKEAAQTAAWLNARGLKAVVLPVSVKAQGNTLAKARAARYAALKDYCQSHAIPALFIGQHQDDQAETVWLALKRGSGITGLAGILPRRVDGSLTLYRPLLSFPKSRLEATCRYYKQPWLSDPSNYADKDRAAYRAVPERLKILPHRLGKTAAAAAAAEELLHKERAAAASALRTGNSIDRSGFLALPTELQRRLVVEWIRGETGAPIPSRARGISEILRRLRQGVAIDAHGLSWRSEGTRITLAKTAPRY